METLVALALVFYGLIQVALESQHRSVVPASVKGGFPATNKNICSFRQVESQAAHKFVERLSLFQDIVRVATPVEEALKGGYSWREILEVVEQDDDVLVDLDHLDAVRIDRAVWIADVDGMCGEMSDRGFILNTQVSRAEHRELTLNTCHGLGRKHRRDAACPANDGR